MRQLSANSLHMEATSAWPKSRRHGLSSPVAKRSLAPPSLRNGRKNTRPGQARRKSRFEQLEDRRVLAAFTAGDLAVVRTGDGVTALAGGTSTATFIDEYTPAGASPVHSIPLPTADVTSGGITEHALTMGGTAGSEGELNLSTNGQYLLLTGYDTAPGNNDGGLGISSTTSTSVPRTVAEIGVNGSVNTTTALTDFANKNNPRAAFSTDGTQIWLAGADSTTGAVRYIDGLSNSTTTSTNLTATNLKNARDVEVFNGQLYISTPKKYTGASANDSIDTLGTGLPNGNPGEPGGATPPAVGVTGATVGLNLANSKPDAFFFARLGTGTAASNGYDTLYVADGSLPLPPAQANTSTPGITKIQATTGPSWTSESARSIPGTTSEGLTPAS